MSARDTLAEVDAHAGALHRELVHALQITRTIEHLVSQQLRALRAMAMSVDMTGAAGERVIAAAVTYWQACQRDDVPAMVRSFVALGRAVGAYERSRQPAEAETASRE